jgi:hypothetical protein
MSSKRNFQEAAAARARRARRLTNEKQARTDQPRENPYMRMLRGIREEQAKRSGAPTMPANEKEP